MSQQRNKLRLLGALLIAIPTTITALATQAAAADDDRTFISLPKEIQPIPRRPTLDAIKRSASRRGLTLAQGIDEYVAHTVATDPSVTARAKADGVDPSAEPELKIDDLWLSELADLKLVVRDQGMTFEEAIKRIAWQPRINEIGAALQRRFPSEVSGLSVLDNGLKAQIGFKGKIPGYAVELAKTLPVAVDLVGNKGFSQADLKQARDVAFAEVFSKKDLVETLSGSYDTDSGIVTIAVKPRSMPSSKAEQQALLSRLQPANPANIEIRVRVRLSGQALSIPQDSYMRGGGNLSGCTTGFNIINGNFPSDPNARLATTAAHCGTGSWTYCNHPAQGGCTTSSHVKHSTSIDIGSWTRGTFTLTRTFYYDYNQSRYVYYVGSNPAQGQNICNYGHARQYAACGNVKAIDQSYPNAANLVVMDRSMTVTGDSGGPWYKYNTAWGIHHGLCEIGVEYNSCFTPVTSIASALNATGQSWGVWTAPPGT